MSLPSQLPPYPSGPSVGEYLHSDLNFIYKALLSDITSPSQLPPFPSGPGLGTYLHSDLNFIYKAILSSNESAVGNLNDRGDFDAHLNLFPSIGGSGTAGAILKGNLWRISVAGTLGGTPVYVGYTIRALVDNPTNSSADWNIINVGLGYLPVNKAGDVMSGGLKVEVNPTVTPNNGTLSIGGAPFDGSSSGKFVGSSSGTSLAINEISGYAGNLADFQINGSSAFSFSSSATLNIKGDYPWTGGASPLKLIATGGYPFSGGAFIEFWNGGSSHQFNVGLGGNTSYYGGANLFAFSNIQSGVVSMIIGGTGGGSAGDGVAINPATALSGPSHGGLSVGGALFAKQSYYAEPAFRIESSAGSSYYFAIYNGYLEGGSDLVLSIGNSYLGGRLAIGDVSVKNSQPIVNISAGTNTTYPGFNAYYSSGSPIPFGLGFNLSEANYVVTFAVSGITLPYIAINRFGAPTIYGAYYPNVITDYANVYIEAPLSSGIPTITSSWGLWNVGNTRLDGTRVNINNLPTSASGLSSGDIWNNGGVLNIM